MQTIKIFLASSFELKADRDALRLFISVENDRLIQKGIYLQLVQWEYFLDAIATRGLQKEYNKAVKDCDIVLSLFFTRAGKYTQEEFETAYQQFQSTGKPLIYTYFKNEPVNMQEIDAEKYQSLVAFKNRLQELGHFPTLYQNIDDLKVQFRRQLDRWLDTKEPIKSSTPKPSSNPQQIKKLIANGKLEMALQQIADIASDDLQTEVILLQGRYNSLKKQKRQGVISESNYNITLNQITYATLELSNSFEEELFESSSEPIPDWGGSEPEEACAAEPEEASAAEPEEPPKTSSPPKKSDYQTGVLLHNVPPKMQLNNIHRCVIRIAFDKKKVLKNLPSTVKNKTIREDVRISEKMEVTFEENAFFDINPINSSAQLVDAYEATEWNFDVQPKQLGKFPITFRISVILANGLKEVVLTESVEVVTETVESAMVFREGNLEPNSEKNTPRDNTRDIEHLDDERGGSAPSSTTSTPDTQASHTDTTLSKKVQKILFLAANPSDASRVQVDYEHRIIKAEMERGSHRDNFIFLPSQFAVTTGELLRALNDNPTILHFSGHGKRSGIAITTQDNKVQLLPTSALKRLFRRLKGICQLVILNSCHSAEQAKVISAMGFYVIGHNIAIEDAAAISFAKGFYNGLGEGKTIAQAYDDAIFTVMAESPDNAAIIEAWKDGEKLNW